MSNTRPLLIRLPERLKDSLRARHGRSLAAKFRGAAASPPAHTDWTPRETHDASISLRLSPEDLAHVEQLAERHGLTRMDAALRLLEALDDGA